MVVLGSGSLVQVFLTVLSNWVPSMVKGESPFLSDCEDVPGVFPPFPSWPPPPFGPVPTHIYPQGLLGMRFSVVVHNHPLLAFIFDFKAFPALSLPLAKMGEIEAEGDIYMEFGQESKTQGLIQGSLLNPQYWSFLEREKRPKGLKVKRDELEMRFKSRLQSNFSLGPRV